VFSPNRRWPYVATVKTDITALAQHKGTVLSGSGWLLAVDATESLPFIVFH
jgi:hypothetical protein